MVKRGEFLSWENDDLRRVVGAVEPVKIEGVNFLARIDSGATRNSISREVVSMVGLGTPTEVVRVRNSHGITKRNVYELEVEIAGVRKLTKFNVSDRSKMKYPVLIGRNLLREGFLIDCSYEDRDN